jgi:leucyl aminopeptidase (aminopeptidase T)
VNTEEKIKMFKDVFAPKKGEQVLLLTDIPHNDIKDNDKWKDRRKMAHEWYEIFKDMGEKEGFFVNFNEYKATGLNNSPIPQKILDIAGKTNLVLVMTEYSATSSFVTAFRNKESTTRGASMPMVEKRMEETAFKADYRLVQKYAVAIEKMLNISIGAEVIFSTGDTLFLDLRNRMALSDKGECVKPGQFINFPSGEACKVPYEAVSDEKEEFGESKTEGILPVAYDKEIVKFKIKNNTIVEVIGESIKAQEMCNFFVANPTRANIAELGIGCNPNAVITGNVLEDEKVGLHIAYGMSVHLGGKIKSDMHQDICYSKGCPIEGTTLTLINKDGSKIYLIQDAMLRYELII